MKLAFNFFRSDKLKKILEYLIFVFLFFYVFSIPSFGQRETWNLITYFAMFLLGAVCLLYFILFLPKKFDKSLILIPLFAVYSFIGTAIYSHQFRNWLSIALLAISFAIFYIAFRCINNTKKTIYLIIFALTLFGAYYIIHYRNELLAFQSYDHEKFRIGTFFDNQNGVSAVAAIGLSLSLFALLFFKEKFKWTVLISIAFFLIVGLSTGSRTFLIAILAFILLSTFFRFKKNKLLYFSIVITIVGVFFLLINLPFSSTLKDRFIRLFDTFFTDGVTVDTSAIMRSLWFKYGLYLGNYNILFGNGAAGFSIISGVGTYTHSNFSEVYCDFGIVGLILFYAPLAVCVYKSFKRKTVLTPLIICMVIYYLIISFSNVFFYNKLYYAIIALMFYSVIDSEGLMSKPVSKIVFTCDGMNSGGAEKVIATLSNELSAKGIGVTIIGVSSIEQKSFYTLDESVKYITINNVDNTYKYLSRVHQLRKAIKKEKPDAVISFLPHVNVYTWLALLGTSIPHIVSERNNPAIDPKKKSLRFMKSLAFLNSNGCVFQTNDARDYFGHIIARKSCIISNPIHVKMSREESNIIQRSKKIICVGRLTEQKNFECSIDAFNIFHRINPSFEMHIIGDGERRNALVEKINLLGLQNSVFLDGLLLDWQEKYKDAFCFILSSNYEGMPNALAEALASGIPCISTDCEPGGPRAFIKNGINGLLVNVDSPKEIASCLNVLLNDNIALQFRKNNDNLLKTHSPTKICEKWIGFIEVTMKNNVVKF